MLLINGKKIGNLLKVVKAAKSFALLFGIEKVMTNQQF